MFNLYNSTKEIHSLDFMFHPIGHPGLKNESTLVKKNGIDKGSE
jgi:hypothetical protein